MVVTPEGFPLGYEVLPGNTLDKKTLNSGLAWVEKQYGKVRRVWVMDRGIPTEETLERMRRSDPPVGYLVGTPKGRLWKGSSLYFSDRLFLPEYRLTGACVLLMSTTIIWCSSADPVAGMAWLQSTYTIRRETGKNRGLTLF